jgi:hypothetical protein
VHTLLAINELNNQYNKSRGIIMLIMSGRAQFINKTSKYVQGDVHSITLFSNKGSFDDNLLLVEGYLNDLGWDDIFIDETEIIKNKIELKHEVLIGGYEKAIAQDISVVVNNIALDKAA